MCQACPKFIKTVINKTDLWLQNMSSQMKAIVKEINGHYKE